MARPKTQVGTWGRVSVTPFAWDSERGAWSAVPALTPGHRADRWRARSKYRDLDGKLRDVERWADTKSAAEHSLLVAMRDRVTPSDADAGHLGPDSTIKAAAEAWLREAESRDLANGTLTLYRYAVTNYVVPLLGDLTVREVRPANVDRFLRTISKEHGHGSAKTARAVLSGLLGVAVRHDAIRANPVRNAARLPTGTAAGRNGQRDAQPRALTIEEQQTLLAKLSTSETAQRYDLADLIDYMLRTGCRIGEAAALRWDQVDLAAGTVEINATITRVKGKGLLIQERPKTKAGWRVLALPPSAVDMLQRRLDAARIGPQQVVFPSPTGRLRDASNTADELRKVLDSLGFTWVTSHTFRKTVATRLDDAGLSARQIADQLGHARPSLTQDTYMGRRVVTSQAADLL